MNASLRRVVVAAGCGGGGCRCALEGRVRKGSSPGPGAQRPAPRQPEAGAAAASPRDTCSAEAQSVAARRSAKAGQAPGLGAAASTAPAARYAVLARQEMCPHRPPTAGKGGMQQVLFLCGFLSVFFMSDCLFVCFSLFQLSCNKRERRSEPRRNQRSARVPEPLVSTAGCLDARPSPAAPHVPVPSPASSPQPSAGAYPPSTGASGAQNQLVKSSSSCSSGLSGS